MKELNKQVGGVERVDEIMDGVREEQAKVAEVSGVLGEVEGVDEGEVDEEMAALEREVEEKRRQKERVVEEHRLQKEREMLPSVPLGEVTMSNKENETVGAKKEVEKAQRRLSIMSLEELREQVLHGEGQMEGVTS